MRGWTNHEVAMVAELRRKGTGFNELCRLLGRTRGSVRGYINRNHILIDKPVKQRTMMLASVKREAAKREIFPPSNNIVSSVNVPLHILAERDKRANERSAMSAAQIICGDPPPSQSALAKAHSSRPRGLVQSRESLRD